MSKKYFYEKNVKMFLWKNVKKIEDDNMVIRKENEKPITIKLYKPTHAKLKIYSTISDKSLDEVIAETLNEIIDIDIAKFVEEGLKRLEKEDEEADYIPKEFDDFDDSFLEQFDYVHPKKKVNVSLPIESHKKLKIIASIYDESLETIASNAIENKINQMDIVNMVSEEFNGNK